MARLLVCLLLLSSTFMMPVTCLARSFGIDYEKDTFLKDGEPFRYVFTVYVLHNIYNLYNFLILYSGIFQAVCTTVEYHLFSGKIVYKSL